jgi:hypothetical protein
MLAKTVKERVNSHRDRLRRAGFKTVQIWVPDIKAPGFAAECKRQSLIIKNDPVETRDLELLAELGDWGDE